MVDHLIKFILIYVFIGSKREILVFGVFGFLRYFIMKIFKHANKNSTKYQELYSRLPYARQTSAANVLMYSLHHRFMHHSVLLFFHCLFFNAFSLSCRFYYPKCISILFINQNSVFLPGNVFRFVLFWHLEPEDGNLFIFMVAVLVFYMASSYRFEGMYFLGK